MVGVSLPDNQFYYCIMSTFLTLYIIYHIIFNVKRNIFMQAAYSLTKNNATNLRVFTRNTRASLLSKRVKWYVAPGKTQFDVESRREAPGFFCPRRTQTVHTYSLPRIATVRLFCCTILLNQLPCLTQLQYGANACLHLSLQ